MRLGRLGTASVLAASLAVATPHAAVAICGAPPQPGTGAWRRFVAGFDLVARGVIGNTVPEDAHGAYATRSRSRSSTPAKPPVELTSPTGATAT